MQKSKVVSADVYDALEFAAEVEGGVGAGVMVHGGCAVCGYGLAYLAGVLNIPKRSQVNDDTISKALYDKEEKHALPFSYEESDEAVNVVRSALRLSYGARVPFPAWAKEIGLVRGE